MEDILVIFWVVQQRRKEPTTNCTCAEASFRQMFTKCVKPDQDEYKLHTWQQLWSEWESTQGGFFLCPRGLGCGGVWTSGGDDFYSPGKYCINLNCMKLLCFLIPCVPFANVYFYFLFIWETKGELLSSPLLSKCHQWDWAGQIQEPGTQLLEKLWLLSRVCFSRNLKSGSRVRHQTQALCCVVKVP